MIQLSDIAKSFGTKDLFSEISWHVDRYPRVGLVGPNGAGKSTLLAILSGELEPDHGRVLVPADVSVGYLPQEVGELDGETALLCVMKGRQDLLDLERRIGELQASIGGLAAEALREASSELGELQAEYEVRGGYRLEARARSVMAALGFQQDDFDEAPDTFSGGWRMRLLLSRLLIQSPTLLLLDEPTNHLDLEALQWLEEFLTQYDGTVVIVSHDREFLNRSVNAIAALDHKRMRVYPGNYDDYATAREAEREMLEKQAAQQAREIAATERFIERFRAKATKAKQVQSRVKALEKIDRIELESDADTIHFELPTARRCPKVVARVEGLVKRYGDHVVYDGLDYTIYRGDCIALVGPNGAGKSTFLKILAGVLEFEGGERRLGAKVEVGYFAQHQVEALNLERTVLEEMIADAHDQSLTEIRNILGAFLFRGDAVEKHIKVLSGGEKNRLALAKLLLHRPNLLLMDEPTNHLDLASRDMLESALEQFGGALVFISHDRYFINRLATKVVHVEGRALRDYPGDFTDYRHVRGLEARRQEQSADVDGTAESPSNNGSSKKARRRALADIRARRNDATRTLRERVTTLEESVSKREQELEEIETTLADPSTYEDGADIDQLAMERARLAETVERLMEEWTEAQLALDEADATFDEEEAALDL